jgi:tetratricopeptide (TPR) repeat protein
MRLLETDPRDAHAMAGLIALRGNIDPIQAESRLKTLIASQPEVGQLHFSLGNQFAAQRRWPDAQAAYFKAYTLEPENPDFAFNLAISLDQLRQVKPALDYYRRALVLSETRAFSFDKALASNRISELVRQ